VQWRVLGHATSPGSEVNEDCAGAVGRLAWIMDGASGASRRRTTTEASDAAWLVGVADAFLRNCTATDVGEVIQTLEAYLSACFRTETEALDVAENGAPSACLAVISFEDVGSGHVKLQGAVVGDVCVFVPSAQGPVRWTDDRPKPFEARTLAALAQSSRDGTSPPEGVFDQIRQNRRSLNQVGGYFAVHPLTPWARFAHRFETVVETGCPIVMATDGFLRLTDLFGALSIESLVAELHNERHETLIDELRRLERLDPYATRYLRVKVHDDATVLTVVPVT